MKSITISNSITVSISWQDALRMHIEMIHRNPKTSGLALQHIFRFSKWYEAQFNQVFVPELVTNYDFHLYREISLKQEKVKAATWNSRLWALGILCEWLGDVSLLDGVEGQGQVRGSTKHRSLTNDEYHRLVHALEQNLKRCVTRFEYQNAVRDWAAVMLMLHGLRVEECAMVDAGDVTLRERSGAVLVRNGKGSKERTVPLNLIARNALGEWMKVRTVESSLFGISVRSLQRNVAALGKQIGVHDLTPHWLRYTFAKRLEQNGTAIEQIRDLLGHESIETTRRYLRSSLDELQAAVEGVM